MEKSKLTPHDIFNKEFGYDKTECKCDYCSMPWSDGICDRFLEYIEWLEEKYVETHKGIK